MRAEVDALDNLSAHADYAETLEWLRGFREPLRRTFVTHGEPSAADAVRLHITESLRWTCDVPHYLHGVEWP